MCTFVHTLEREREMGVLSLANEPNEAARGSRRCLFGRALYLPRNESSLCFQAPGRCLLLTRRGIALFPSLCASAASLGPSLSLSLSYSSSSIATTLFLLIFLFLVFLYLSFFLLRRRKRISLARKRPSPSGRASKLLPLSFAPSLEKRV